MTSFFSVIPLVVQAIDWFLANEPALEADAKDILAKSKDILNKIHGLRADLAKAK